MIAPLPGNAHSLPPETILEAIMEQAGAGKKGRLVKLALIAVFCAGVAAVFITVAKVRSSYVKAQHDGELRTMLVPNSELPGTEEQWKARIDALAASYPHDPRLRLFRGITLLDAEDFAGAERELRAGLADVETFKDQLPRQVETRLRTNLALALYGNGQKDEAAAAAGPVCRLDGADSRSMRSSLKRKGLCE
jgi:rhomboid protease GluP